VTVRGKDELIAIAHGVTASRAWREDPAAFLIDTDEPKYFPAAVSDRGVPLQRLLAARVQLDQLIC